MTTKNNTQNKKSQNSLFSDLVDKSSLGYRLAESLSKVIHQTFGIDLKPEEISIDHPKNPDFGDYSTNISFVSNFVIRYSNLNPPEIAKTIVEEWKRFGLPPEVERVDTVGGFANIWLNNEYLISQIEEVLEKKEEYSKSDQLKDIKILLEHTSPNPQTTIMLGHLRNNFLGMTSAHLFANAGAEVKLDCIVNDRGVHICRSMWGYLVFGNKTDKLTKDLLTNFKELDLRRSLLAVYPELVEGQGETLKESLWREKLDQWVKNPSDWWTPEELDQKSDHANLIWYVLGSQAYKEIEGVESQVHEILKEWENNEPKVRKLWQTIIGWSEEGYAQTYKRIGSHHDKYWYESDHWQEGKDIVEDGLKRGVFKLGDVDPKNGKKPIVTDLSNDGLSDTVVIKSDGTGLYMTQDLALTRLKLEKFPSDLYIWDIGLEQTVYFKQLFSVIDKLGIAKKDQLFHLSYALINFKGGGKMATRKGDVVAADETLDLLKDRTLEIMAGSNQVNRGDLSKEELNDLAEKIAVGAVKYSILKYGRETTMQFDIDESLSLTGNSGPYLQYTYTRTQSVINKANLKIKKLNFDIDFKLKIKNLKLEAEELALLRTIYQFPEVIIQATKEFAPNLICNYLFDLAQKFNVFYDRCRILVQSSKFKVQSYGTNDQLPMTNDQQALRLALTSSVGQVIKNGLTLLGIQAPERM